MSTKPPAKKAAPPAEGVTELPKGVTPPKGVPTPNRAARRRAEREQAKPASPAALTAAGAEPPAPTDDQWLEEAAAQEERELLAKLKMARASLMKAQHYIGMLQRQIVNLGATPVPVPTSPPIGAGRAGLPLAAPPSEAESVETDAEAS